MPDPIENIPDQNNFDLAIIGAGPGGYSCAIKAAQLGLKTACIDTSQTPGGTCLHVGCIPSKALLHATARYTELASGALAKIGVIAKAPRLDIKTMMAHKTKIVDANAKGILHLFKKHQISWFCGKAKIKAAGEIFIQQAKGADLLKTRNIVIATGSEPVILPGVTIDEESLLTSTGALSLATPPASMAVIGGGYIGLELGSLWSRLGSKVTIIEWQDRIVPEMDHQISRQLQTILKRQNIDFKLATKLQKVETKKTKKSKKIHLHLAPATDLDAREEIFLYDCVLFAIGRKAYTKNLGLEDLGIALSAKGDILVDRRFATSLAGIYAIGDVIAGPMLAHKAEEEGIALAELLAGQAGMVDHDLIPSVIYTHPEVAMIGKTEQQLQKENIPYKTGIFPLQANARARLENDTQGLVKFLSHRDHDRILGVHIIANGAGNMIGEIAVAMAFSASAEDIARICHPHPTTSEAIKEAALCAYDQPLHL